MKLTVRVFFGIALQTYRLAKEYLTGKKLWQYRIFPVVREPDFN